MTIPKEEELMFAPNYTCRCEQRLQLIPVLDYIGEELRGCHIRGDLCADCPLNDWRELKRVAVDLHKSD